MLLLRQFFLILMAFSTSVILIHAQDDFQVPSSYSNIHLDENGQLYFESGGKKFYSDASDAKYSLDQLFGNPKGTDKGVILDFGDMEGSLTYGLIPYGKAKHPLPVFRFVKELQDGKVPINIYDDFKQKYDFVDWKEKRHLTIGYRLADKKGMIVFDGEVSLKGTGPFEVVPSIFEGPFVSDLSSDGAIIWCKTTMPVKAAITINDFVYKDEKPVTMHVWQIRGLKPETKYDYMVEYGGLNQKYHFTTAPKRGSRKPFVFAYTSDSRHAAGGGERKLYGANAYIMKKAAALAMQEGASFFQFTGDMIDGYLTNVEEQHVQYTNWKKSIEPFWHYFPFNVGMGNHEALGYIFMDEKGNEVAFVDGFPYETHSAEAIFQEAYVNPVNGPVSEDGNKYDPDPDTQDFPSYDESVFYYTYDNVAMVVLNSDYWYAPSMRQYPATSGGLHGYIMDNQLEWLQSTIEMLENDENIDHIFVTQHTPAFPNGGHAKDDMWYHGNNEKRPYVAGEPVDEGIIQRRDQYLDILINKSTKVLAILTGDEHNYNRLKITQEVPIYPENYKYEKLKISRPIYQINNGASGAPYYAQEKLPWSAYTKAFSVENALCLFYVDGDEVHLNVLNPDTLNEIDRIRLK